VRLFKPVRTAHLYNSLAHIFGSQKVTPSKTPYLPGETILPIAQRHPLSILVAEDNTVNQRVLTALLSRLGYESDVVGDGLAAVQSAHKKHYDVILMDIEMPEMDGETATRTIRAELSHQPRIVAITANALQGMREQYLAIGMDDYIGKPVRLAELQRALLEAKANPNAPEPPANQAARPPTINCALMRQNLYGLDEAMIRETMQLFRQNVPVLLQELLQAIEQQDPESTYKAAHKLKGEALIFGAQEFSNLCAQIESLGRTQQMEAVAALATQLQPAWQRLQAEMESCLTQAS